jgi:hypothetical protein
MAPLVLNLRTKWSLNVKKYSWCVGGETENEKKINFVVYCSVAAVLVLRCVYVKKCVGWQFLVCRVYCIRVAELVFSACMMQVLTAYVCVIASQLCLQNAVHEVSVSVHCLLRQLISQICYRYRWFENDTLGVKTKVDYGCKDALQRKWTIKR